MCCFSRPVQSVTSTNASGCLVVEHWIAGRRSLNWINVAFFRLNAVVSTVFSVVTVAEVIFQGGFKLR